jgi:hypothetical protein
MPMANLHPSLSFFNWLDNPKGLGDPTSGVQVRPELGLSLVP